MSYKAVTGKGDRCPPQAANLLGRLIPSGWFDSAPGLMTGKNALKKYQQCEMVYKIKSIYQ